MYVELLLNYFLQEICLLIIFLFYFSLFNLILFPFVSLYIWIAGIWCLLWDSFSGRCPPPFSRPCSACLSGLQVWILELSDSTYDAHNCCYKNSPLQYGTRDCIQFWRRVTSWTTSSTCSRGLYHTTYYIVLHFLDCFRILALPQHQLLFFTVARYIFLFIQL